MECISRLAASMTAPPQRQVITRVTITASHPLPDRIKAGHHLTSEEAVWSKWRGLRFNKLVSPATEQGCGTG